MEKLEPPVCTVGVQDRALKLCPVQALPLHLKGQVSGVTREQPVRYLHKISKKKK